MIATHSFSWYRYICSNLLAANCEARVQFLTCKVNHIELCSMILGDHGSFSCSDSDSVHLLRQHYVLHYIGASERFILLVGSLCIPVNIASENSVNCCEMMLE